MNEPCLLVQGSPKVPAVAIALPAYIGRAKTPSSCKVSGTAHGTGHAGEDVLQLQVASWLRTRVSQAQHIECLNGVGVSGRA